MSDTPSLKDAVGAKLEADNATEVEVEYAGNVYVFPASLDDAPYEVLEAVDDRKATHILRGLLSDAEYAKFKRTRPSVKDADGLFSAFAEKIGLESAPE